MYYETLWWFYIYFICTLTALWLDNDTIWIHKRRLFYALFMVYLIILSTSDATSSVPTSQVSPSLSIFGNPWVVCPLATEQMIMALTLPWMELQTYSLVVHSPKTKYFPMKWPSFQGTFVNFWVCFLSTKKLGSLWNPWINKKNGSSVLLQFGEVKHHFLFEKMKKTIFTPPNYSLSPAKGYSDNLPVFICSCVIRTKPHTTSLCRSPKMFRTSFI